MYIFFLIWDGLEEKKPLDIDFFFSNLFLLEYFWLSERTLTQTQTHAPVPEVKI